MLTATQKEEVLDSYMKASHTVFLLWVPLMGACLVLCIFIKDKGLTRPEEKKVVETGHVREESASEGEVVESGESDVETQARDEKKI